MIRVLIAAPLRQDPRIFRAHQASLDALDIPPGVTVDRLWVVNDCPEVIPDIRGTYTVVDTGDEYEKTDETHIWTTENLKKMPWLRNLTISYALERGYDYLFSIDTDLIVQPATLKWLLDADKDIVSEIFWTIVDAEGGAWCNAWMYDQDGGMTADWLEPGLYRVGMTGACTLIKRSALERGVSYSPLHCIRKALWGEDRWFSIRADVLGCEMWVDTHCPAEHLYTEAAYISWAKRTGVTP